MHQSFSKTLMALPNGSYDVIFERKRYLLSKESKFADKIIKLYAKELGGSDFVSLNFYPYIDKGLLKPCEMPAEKVIAFILNAHVITP
jgi:hypothetical protein